MFMKFKIKIIMGIIILTLLGVGTAIVKKIWDDRDRLGKELAQEQVLHDVTKETVTTLVNRIHEYNGEIDELNKTFAEIRKTTLATLESFKGHNLALLALRKPGLIGNRINAATIRRMRWLEELTQAYSEGRPPTRDEETHARAGKDATAAMGNYNGPLVCTSVDGYEDLAESITELDRYIQQLQQRCGD